MRLYAYGGTGFVERARVGAWPGLSEPVLSSREDVVHADCFGVGLGREGPHLIFRTLIPDARGGYPYTLLLSPSDSTWQLFGWNPALLLVAFLATHRGTLMHPDRVSQSSLQQMEADVCHAAIPSGSLPVPSLPWLSACIGAALGSALAVASPQELDLETTPNLRQTSEISAAIDPCFRIGRGWLVGSTPEIAAALQCALLVTAPPLAQTPLASASSRGLRFFQSWKRLPPALRAPEEQRPMHLWPYTSALAVSFDSAADLAAGADVAPETSGTGTPFASAIQLQTMEAMRAQLRRGLPLGPRSTAWLLDLLQDQAPNQSDAAALSPDEASALDPSELASHLHRHSIPPRPSTLIRLSPQQATTLADHFLRELAPLTLHAFLECCTFLERYSLDGLSLLQPALADAIAHRRASAADLWTQAAGLSDPRGPQLNDLLLHVLDQHMQPPTPASSWLSDAIRLRHWSPSARDLLLHSPDFDAAVRELAQSFASNPSVHDWLGSIAADPLLRNTLSLATKHTLASKSGAWTPFQTLQHLLQGDLEPGHPPPGPDQCASLILELLELADSGLTRRLPNLAGLCAFLQLSATDIAELDRRVRRHLGLAGRLLWRWKLARLPRSFSEHKPVPATERSGERLP